MTEIHHLSHIDLDGYGAQFVAREFFKNIVFYNANYGREVEVRLRDMLGKIKSAKNTSFLILITDLNLTLNADFIARPPHYRQGMCASL